MSASRPIHVLVTFPLAIERTEVETPSAIDPAIEIVGAPYVEEQARRASRDRTAVSELRDGAPPVDGSLRSALAEAEVMLALDAPVDTAVARFANVVDPPA